MSETEELRDADDAIHIGTRRIIKSGGPRGRQLRVTIPEPTRERYDIEKGDVLDLALLIPGHDGEVVSKKHQVDANGQVNVPADVRDAFGLRAGDYFDLTVIPREEESDDQSP